MQQNLSKHACQELEKLLVFEGKYEKTQDLFMATEFTGTT